MPGPIQLHAVYRDGRSAKLMIVLIVTPHWITWRYLGSAEHIIETSQGFLEHARVNTSVITGALL